MLTILAGLVGLIPHIFSFLQARNDQVQELEIMKIQASMMTAGAAMQLQEVGMNAQAAEKTAIYQTMKTNIGWVDAFNGIIRPIIALVFIGKVVIAMYYPESIVLVDHDYGIAAIIIAFYFGGLAKFR